MNGNQLRMILDEVFPQELAYSWDNVGMQIGTFDKEITGIMVALNCTLDVIDEALDKNCNVIFTHHPLIFQPLKQIESSSPIGKIVYKLIQNNITLYVAHTNYDVINGGMNDVLANIMQIKNTNAIEMVTDELGLGRVGTLEKVYNKNDFIAYCKEKLNIDSFKVIGEIPEKINKIAIIGGSGSSNIKDVKELDADVYITGDVTYHHALNALEINQCIFDVGHKIEELAMPALRDLLVKKGVTTYIHVSKANVDPYKMV